MTFTFLPVLSLPYTHFSLLARCQALRLRFVERCSWEEALAKLKHADRLPDPSTVRRWWSGLDCSQPQLSFFRQTIARLAHWLQRGKHAHEEVAPGHVNPEMTMRYVDVALTDLQREFQLARSHPRHLAPQPRAPSEPRRKGLNGLIDSLLASQHVLEMFRRSLPNGNTRSRLDRLSNRFTKLLAEIPQTSNPLE